LLYYDDGLTKSVKDAAGNLTEYFYDEGGRLSEDKTFFGSRKYKYDLVNNRISAEDRNERVTNYGYDNLNRVKSETWVVDGKQFTYSYDENSNLITADDGAIKYVYGYDDTDLVTQVDRLSGTNPIVSFKYGYDDVGNLTRTEELVGNVVKATTDYEYNSRYLNTSITQIGAGLSSKEVKFTYDVAGLNFKVERYLDGLLKLTTTNAFDPFGRLTGIEQKNAGGIIATDSYILDDLNRISRTNIVSGAVDEYAWDYRNRLMGIVSKTSITGTVTRTVGYEYDVDDQRVSKTVNGVVENYYLDGEQVAFVTDGGGNQTFHYLYGLNVDQVLAQDSPAGMVWALADRLGTVDTIADGEGAVVDKRTFDSFGRILSETNPSVSFRYGYTGRELDLESGLNYYRARYYDSNVGRFISVDPIGFAAGDTNLYRYVGNSSTNATDPSGEFWNFVAGAAIGAVLDVGFQVYENWGTGKGIDLTRVAISAIAGAVGGGIGGALLKQGTGLAARTALNAGVGFNLGYWGKVTENKIGGKELFDGALFTGIAGGAGAAAGELLQAGIGAAWNKYTRLDRVGNQLDNMAAETQDLIRQLDDNFPARLTTPGNNTNRFEQIADPWLSPVNSPVRSIPSGSLDVPDGAMSLADRSIMSYSSRMLPGITKKYIPSSNVPVNISNPVHYVNQIQANSKFGGGDVKTIARGNVNLDIDVAEIQNGLAVRLKNGNILTSSGKVYGIHTDGSNGIFPISGSPDTVDLTKGEFDLFKKMIKAGGLKGKALQLYETRMAYNAPSGLDAQTPQKLTDLYNSRN
jgi:RHS repeat-associated protein